MNQVEWMRKRREALKAILDQLAHKTCAALLPAERYAVAVGRYQGYKNLITYFDNEIAKLMKGADEGDGTEMGLTTMEDDADFDPPQPRATRTRTARNWGG